MTFFQEPSIFYLKLSLLEALLWALSCKLCCMLLIHEADPQSRPVVIIIFAHVVCSYVRQYVRQYVRPSPLFKTKHLYSENNVRYWQNYGSGRVDHWWHLFCTNIYLSSIVYFWRQFFPLLCQTRMFITVSLFSAISHLRTKRLKKQFVMVSLIDLPKLSLRRLSLTTLKLITRSIGHSHFSNT